MCYTKRHSKVERLGLSVAMLEGTQGRDGWKRTVFVALSREETTRLQRG